MAQELQGLAESITQEPGFIWKVWTENKNTHEAGGIYLFENEETATAYLNMHAARLKGFGITEIHAKIFDVNDTLTTITRGPLT